MDGASNESWATYSGAPKIGARVCAMSDFGDSLLVCLDLDGFPLLLLRLGNRINAFINLCPHRDLPLNYRSNDILTPDHKILRCSNHVAGFDTATGEGVNGLAVGHCLEQVPVFMKDGAVFVGHGPD